MVFLLQISGIVAIVDMEGFGWEHIMQVLYMKYTLFSVKEREEMKNKLASSKLRLRVRNYDLPTHLLADGGEV